MAFCRGCGKEVEDDWKSCPFCSSPIDPPAQRKRVKISKRKSKKSDSKQIEIQDSVVMGDVKTTNLTIVNEKDIHSHMQVMIDAIRDGRNERAMEVYDAAKKIDYSFATHLHDVEYKDKIVEARIDAFVNDYDQNVEGAGKGHLHHALDEDLWKKHIDVVNRVKSQGLSLLEQKPDSFRVLAILGRLGIEYRGIGQASIRNTKLTLWVVEKMKVAGYESKAEKLLQKYNDAKSGDGALLIVTLVGIVVLGGILVAMMGSL